MNATPATQTATRTIEVGIGAVTIADVVDVARNGYGVALTAESLAAIAEKSCTPSKRWPQTPHRSTEFPPDSPHLPPGTFRRICGHSCSAA